MGSGHFSPDAPRPFTPALYAPNITQESPAAPPDGPQFFILDILWLQKERAWMRMPDRGQSLTPTECGQRFHPPLHTSCTVDCLSTPSSGGAYTGYYDR
jgi:hypothetical protein